MKYESVSELDKHGYATVHSSGWRITYPVLFCTGCGALVADQRLHDDFHNKEDDE